MKSDRLIREIFEKYRTIAVYGMSSNPEKPAHSVPAFLLSKGFQIIPINPHAGEILGQKCYSHLEDIPGKIEVVEVFRPPDQVLEVVKEVLARRKAKEDVAVIWLQEGIKNQEARKLSTGEGLIFIQDRCMKQEFQRLYDSSP